MAATNVEPLGPYNKELLDILILSHNPKQLLIIESVLSKRLMSYMDEFSSYRSVRSSHKSFSLRRSASTNTHSYSDMSPSPSASKTIVDANLLRSNSYHGDGYLQDKQSLTILKTLTVILYLLQYGSNLFIDWIKIKYIDYIIPLNAMKFNGNYNQSIRSKITTIIKYCENTNELRDLRVNINKLRSDMTTPGLKKLVSISDEIQYSPPNSPTLKSDMSTSSSNFQFTRVTSNSSSYDPPRYNHSSDDEHNSLIDSRLHDLTPVYEENNSIHSQNSASNLLNCHDEQKFAMLNNPFQIPNLFR